MNDYMLRVMSKEAGVRGLACVTTDLVAEAAQRHATSPTATVALGQALTAGILVGTLLKVRQRVALKFVGDGPLQKVVVEADHYGRVRGYVNNPQVDLPPLLGGFDVASALGRSGILTAVKDLRLKELAESVVSLSDGDINDHLMVYLNQSEQVPSATQIGVVLNDEGEVMAAGGLLLQSLPPHTVRIINQLQERMQEMPPMAELIHGGETPEEIMATIFHTLDYRELETFPVKFKCNCSRARTERALMILGKEELQSLLATEGEAHVECHFCHESYHFNRTELEEILADLEESV